MRWPCLSMTRCFDQTVTLCVPRKATWLEYLLYRQVTKCVSISWPILYGNCWNYYIFQLIEVQSWNVSFVSVLFSLVAVENLYYSTEFPLSHYSMYQLSWSLYSVVKNGCRLNRLRNRSSGSRRGVLTSAVEQLAELGRERMASDICICSRRFITGCLHAFWHAIYCTPAMLSLSNLKWRRYLLLFQYVIVGLSSTV
jgi:hypothetical protein